MAFISRHHQQRRCGEISSALLW